MKTLTLTGTFEGNQREAQITFGTDIYVEQETNWIVVTTSGGRVFNAPAHDDSGLFGKTNLEAFYSWRLQTG
jgi:hypothetical protein